MDDPLDTEMIKRRKYIEEVSTGGDVVPLDSLKKALEMNRVCLEENVLDIIYYGRGSGDVV